LSIARGVRHIMIGNVGGCICIVAGPPWVAIVRCVSRSIRVVGHVAEVATSAGIILKLVISMLHFLIRRLRLNLYAPIFVGRSSCGRGRGRGNGHHGVPCISIDDVASWLVHLEVGGPGAI
jgi:hypothetical protein